VSRLGLEPRALALKGELTPLLKSTQPEIFHTSAHQLHSDLGLHGGCLGRVHGQNTDKRSPSKAFFGGESCHLYAYRWLSALGAVSGRRPEKTLAVGDIAAQAKPCPSIACPHHPRDHWNHHENYKGKRRPISTHYQHEDSDDAHRSPDHPAMPFSASLNADIVIKQQGCNSENCPRHNIERPNLVS
jgi:hypothetical protein